MITSTHKLILQFRDIAVDPGQSLEEEEEEEEEREEEEGKRRMRQIWRHLLLLLRCDSLTEHWRTGSTLRVLCAIH